MKSLSYQLQLETQVVSDELAFIPSKSFNNKEANAIFSKKERMGYLIDQALQFINFLVHDHQKIKEIHLLSIEEKKLELEKYQHSEQEHLIALWTNLNKHISELIADIDKSRGQKSYRLVIDGQTETLKLKLIVERYIDMIDEEIQTVLAPLHA